MNRLITIGWLFVLAVLCSGVGSAHGQRDRGSWKQTLRAKALHFEENAAQRHNIVGSYPSSVRLLPPKHYAGPQEGAWSQIVATGALPRGWIVDHGTTGLSNVAHTSSWTGCLLTAEAFRVAALRKQLGTASGEYRQAVARADEIIQALRILTLVSGKPGYLARGVALGHGVSYEERAGAGTRDLWKQGVGQYAYLRYRGGPSHHNYDQVFRGLGIYYVVAADDRQKDKIRAIVRDMSNWAHLRKDLVVSHDDGTRESTVLIGGWRGMEGDNAPSGGSLMALTGLKIAHLVTGNPRTKQLYDHWVERLGLRDPQRNQANIMGRPRSNYDDTDHLLGDLYLLNRIEKDPKLLAYYRKCVKDSWEVHKGDKMAWFNFVFWAVLGEDFGDPAGSIWNLRTFPTCRIFQPQMNSIRTDLKWFTGPADTLFSRGPTKESLEPLPVHQRPFDNEYTWKASPYRLDAWLSRIVSVLEVSPCDPYVQLAADTSGTAYWSNTKGEVWHKVDALAGVRDFVFSPDYPWIVFAATGGGVYRSLDGGVRWQKTLSQGAVRLTLDPHDSTIVYAVCADGVHKSADLGERAMGTIWQRITPSMPAGTLFAVDPQRQPAVVFALARDGVYTASEDAVAWRAYPRVGRTRGFSTVDAIGGQPLWLRADRHVPKRLFRAVQTRRTGGAGTIISVSDDDGMSWSPVIRQLKPLLDWSQGTGAGKNLARDDLQQLFALARKFGLRDLRVDRRDPATWYGMLEGGVATSHDAGTTWKVSAAGLDIPRIGALWTPRHADLVMVGTPAGMYLSRDQAASWRDTPLILQGDGAIRSEIGGAGYLTAYWLGRYHGFISDAEATRAWWE